MASRKKQEDKNLKLLRELVTQYPNKKCFDCGQRGPTYVNMTIGAFVCTSCSGPLRGLNPPHRIKSISMASFNQTEIEFLQKHGNEVCRNTWLALWKSTSDNESHEDIKDHLVNKYERKVWYSDQVQNVAPETPAVKPLKSLLGNESSQVYVSTPVVVNTTISPLHVVASQASAPVPKPSNVVPRQQASSNMDLLGNLGADPFGSTAHNANQSSFGTFQQPPPPQSQQPIFNAFPAEEDNNKQDSFDLFVSSRPSNQISNVNFSANAAPSGQPSNNAADKYAALAELDLSKATLSTQSVFSGFSAHGNPSATVGTSQPNPFMSADTSLSGAAVFQQQQQKPANPFQSSSLPSNSTIAMQNIDIFQQMPPQNTLDVNKQSSFSWGMPNGNVNVASNTGNPAVGNNQPNFNFAFGSASQQAGQNAPVQSNTNIAPNLQQAPFGTMQAFGNNQSSAFQNSQSLVFHNSQQQQFASQDTLGFPPQQFNPNFQNQTNEQVSYGQNPQQTFASSFPQQPSGFSTDKSISSFQPSNFSQTPLNQGSFAFNSQMAHKQPTKSTNPFM